MATWKGDEINRLTLTRSLTLRHRPASQQNKWTI